MSLVNTYLKETPLTSTKNKYLWDRHFIENLERCEEPESLRKRLKRDLKISSKCLTENKILLESKLHVWEDNDVPIKKKKKKCKYRSVKQVDYPCLPDSVSLSEQDAEDCCDAVPTGSFSLTSQTEADQANGIFGNVPDSMFAAIKAAPPPVFNNMADQANGIFGNVPDSMFAAIKAAPPPVFNNMAGSMFAAMKPAQPLVHRDMAGGGEGSPVYAYARAQRNKPVLFGSRSTHLEKSVMKGFGALDPATIPEIFITKMPTYDLEVLKLCQIGESEFLSLDINASYRYQKCFSDFKEKKMELINVVSMALMYSSNLKNEDDPYRIILNKSVNDVKLFDPEFILKVALYARQELHIRTVTNFLLASAAFDENSRLYLEKYFEACIVLPSDWMQVAEYYKVLSAGSSKQPFPAALRRALKKTFTKFDQYQLAKYNREDKKKKMTVVTATKHFIRKIISSYKYSQTLRTFLTHMFPQPSCSQQAVVTELDSDVEKESTSDSSSSDDDVVNHGDDYDKDKDKEKEKENENKEKKTIKHTCTFTLKKLIHILHIDSPAENVLRLLGKKYPSNHEDFKSSGLLGTWDPSKAGTRMKLPIPETWETKLSLHGNVPHAWESLIDNNKLPYMATLRNIKNLILSGISPAHHKKVIKHLENKTAVINSRQLPMQFFAAYKVISDLEDMVEGKTSKLVEETTKRTRWSQRRLMKLQERLPNASISIIKEYKNAVSNAVEISSLNNLHPVPGKTVVICIIDPVDRNSNKPNAFETCLMMGLMCLKACEDCKLSILGFSDTPDIIPLNESDKFLDVMLEICEKYKKMTVSSSHTNESMLQSLEKVLDYYLRPQTTLSLKLDHIVLLEQSEACFSSCMSSFLHKYRQIVNSNLLYTNVKFTIKTSRFTESSVSEKDVYLSGASSSLIKFIAERSIGGQLAFVDNIDMKYDLPKVPELKKKLIVTDHSLPSHSPDKTTVVPVICKVPKWHTVRIFVSSTFKDMMSERDLLVRFVFPELRRRAASVFVRIAEIDLRWGITEADSSTQRAAELCLLEAQKADFFVGMIGDRYGTIYTFDPPTAPELQWVKEHPSGLSITELEMRAAALRHPESSRQKAFFYFRDNSFLSHVPKKWANHFSSEDENSKNKVEELKSKIRKQNFKILEGYPCHFAGIYEKKPILAGLHVLGNRVLEDLWDAVQKVHKKDPYYDNVGEEELYQQNLIDSQNFYVGEKNFPIENIVKRIKSDSGIFVISGCAGSGKTTFAVQLLQHLKGFPVVKFFIGLSPRSRDLSYMLQYICNSIAHVLSISLPLPNLPHDIVNQFPDLLMEAVNCSGGRDIIMIIDGLDHLEKDDQNLDWLPLSLPNGVKFICTVSETSDAFKILSARQYSGSDIIFEELPPLQQSDQEKFVRNYLKYYSKAFEESDFNNHMLKVVTKKDSSNPYYLRVVCEFLRIYATFENLAEMLQKLPSTVILLFQEIILQMEGEFGSNLVQTVLTILCITKEGLEESDLHYILSFVMHVNEMKSSLSFCELKQKIRSFEPDHLICQVKFCSIAYVVNTFSHNTVNGQKTLCLMGTEFEKSVKKFYLNKNYVTQSIYLHSVLAGYYFSMCDINDDGKYSGQSGYAVRSLLYHLFHANLFKELCDLLCSHRFLVAVFRTNAGPQLLEYYSALLFDILPSNQKVSREINSFDLFTFYDFVSRNFHIFHQYPQLVMQQALNEPSNSVVSLKSEDCNHHFFENLSRSELLDYRLATFSGFLKNITASAGGKNKPLVVLGSEDGYLKILDLSTRKVCRSIKGHVSAITCITFVGKNRLCASSVDGTLSLWNSVDFSRVAVLKGHRHNVTSCCGDPSASILFSSGWDNSVRLWSLVDGRSISVIDSFRCPVNCIDHHPLKQQIACGLWNGNVEIWDTVSMKKILEFSSFSGSVKSLAYTPDGVNIISSFFGSEISIWSSEEGLKISSLKGHMLSVKALSLSYDNSIFVSGSDDCTLKVWSSVHGSHFSTISDCKFCPINLMNFLSENLIAVAFQNSEIWIIDINNGNVTCKFTLESDFLSAFSKHTFITNNPQEHDDNIFEKLVVFGTKIGKLMIGDLLTSTTSERFDMGVKITAIIHNCDTIVCGTAEGDIGIFSYPGETISETVFGAHRGFITTFSLTLKEEKLLLLSTANDNALKLWNIEKYSGHLTLQEERFNSHKDGITCSLFHPYNSDSSPFNNLLTGSHDNNIILWSEDSVKVLQGLHSSIVNIACSGEYILGCSNDGAVNMWSRSGKILTTLPRIELSSATLTFFVAEDDINKFTVILAFVDQDGSITIKKPLQKTYSCSFEGHSKPVTSCCTTENGDVISCSLDGSVNLWKVPTDNANIALMHSSMITGIIASSSLEFAVSSDAHGNLILWKINLEAASAPLTYAGKKNYTGGFIRAISWLKGHNFVCAGNQAAENGRENHFLHIISLEDSLKSATSAYSFQVKKSFHFESEVSCVDSCPSSDVIVVGLKSGNAIVIESGIQHNVNVSSDWLLGVQLFSYKETSDFFCTSLVNGDILVYKMKDVIKDQPLLHYYEMYTPPEDFKDSKFTTVSVCCGKDNLICCGDSEGVLRIYSRRSLKFIKKVHNEAISGLCVVDSYLFTCSFDKSVKGWDLKSFNQVCQFYSSVPISYLTSPNVISSASDKRPCLLLMGTVSGTVHLLKLHCK